MKEEYTETNTDIPIDIREEDTFTPYESDRDYCLNEYGEDIWGRL